MKLNDCQVQSLCDYLVGSCRTFEEGLETIGYVAQDALEFLDNDTLAAIEDTVLLCDNCSWWWAAEEMKQDVCPDCRQEEECESED